MFSDTNLRKGQVLFHSPVAIVSVWMQLKGSQPCYDPLLGYRLISIFSLSLGNDVYLQFTYVDHAFQPGTPADGYLRLSFFTSRLKLKQGYVVTIASYKTVTGHACIVRLLLTEQ